MVNKMWHIAIEEGTTRLQDVVVASVPIEDLALLRVLLSTQHLKGMSVETERGNYLLMYDGDSERPYSDVIVWRYRVEGDENIIEDMQMEDSWILEHVWRYWLMPEETDAEYVSPGQFVMMGRRKS